MADTHPFARYPYRPNPPPPRYVGPAWAAPGPPQHLPLKRPQHASKSSGCLTALLITSAIAIGAPACLLFAAILLVAGSARHRPTAPPVAASDDDKPVTPAPEGSLPARSPVDPKVIDGPAEKSWAYDYCGEDKPMKSGNIERRSAYYQGYMNRGTGKRMRGKVAVVHLLLSSPSLSWTMGQARDVDRAALLSARFFSDMSREHGVTDLELTAMSWKLSTHFVAPTLVSDQNMRVDNASSREVVRSALAASESSLAATMEAVAATLKTEGFGEVAFLLHLPIKVKAREFAYPAPLFSNVDVAIVFHESLDRLDFVTAHETMHLFGADDLYPLDSFDSADTGDIMRANCLGFGGLRVRDMSAYAIGWRATPPVRAYSSPKK